MRRPAFLVALVVAACGAPAASTDRAIADAAADSLLAMYTTVRLDADLSGLTEREKQMLPLLMDAARAMDEIFWLEAVGQRDSVLSKITHDGMRRFVEINYGPWDRLNGNRPFLAEVGELPPAEVGVGDVVIIPPGVRQRISNSGSGDLIFLAICSPRFAQRNYRDLSSAAPAADAADEHSS